MNPPKNLEWLRKQAKRHLAELRKSKPDATLSEAQLDIARENGFPSWRALKAHVDSLSVDGQLFDAAKKGDVATLTALLDAHPEKLTARDQPYEFTLLHAAAREGQLAAVDLLLRRGIDPNVREKGDNTYPMHWAAAAGKLDVVRRLADAGGDVVGHGDDHEIEVIGWASCWEGTEDDAHRAVVDFLLSRGARHHIFSAIAHNLGDEVRRIVANNPATLSSRLSRNENHQTPLHFAVGHDRPHMVALLVELGADPLAADGFGYPPAMYAESPDVDLPVMVAIRALTGAELLSAERGQRPIRGGVMDLLASVALRDWAAAARLVRDNPDLLKSGGVLHLATKRNDLAGMKWLLEQGADPNARWAHWDADVTPLHLAALMGNADAARLLLQAGGDARIKDSRHDSDALGWAEFFHRDDIVQLLKGEVAH
ncbi:MAG TPA: ankyrin repeat domain-containing protein [Gemmatimonadales bacterium]|nr:ankyrin repeat domain-containing protein [Gemmatimonadales bacterium]